MFRKIKDLLILSILYSPLYIFTNTYADSGNVGQIENFLKSLIEIKERDSKYFKNILSTMTNHIFNDEITEKVIEIRKATNIELPDAIIAATALVNGLTLWTHNIKDFKKIPGLKFVNPIVML